MFRLIPKLLRTRLRPVWLVLTDDLPWVFIKECCTKLVKHVHLVHGGGFFKPERKEVHTVGYDSGFTEVNNNKKNNIIWTCNWATCSTSQIKNTKTPNVTSPVAFQMTSLPLLIDVPLTLELVVTNVHQLQLPLVVESIRLGEVYHHA